jgi:hypothetical protein
LTYNLFFSGQDSWHKPAPTGYLFCFFVLSMFANLLSKNVGKWVNLLQLYHPVGAGLLGAPARTGNPSADRASKKHDRRYKPLFRGYQTIVTQ